MKSTTGPSRIRPRVRAVRSGAVLAVIGLAVTGLGACGDNSASYSSGTVVSSPKFPAGTTMARLAAVGKMTIGTKYDQPGFGMIGLGGAPEGFDIEIGKIIAAQLGIQPSDITWKEATSAVREELLERNEVDIVAATYTINAKRKTRVSFAGPYYVAGEQIMVKKDNTTITGPDSLKSQPDVKVCSATGSTSAQDIARYLARPAQLVTFDDYSKCAAALRTNQVDAVATDNVILIGLVNTGKGAFKLVGDPFTEEPYGIGVKKGDLAFCTFIDTTLKSAVTDGSYQKAWKSTAGALAGSPVPTLPTTDPCA
jgi:glutamate transport system substrate-binding protein